jgi:DNA-directed RNA polymerase subunit M/transcription elongation factor TFIIS
MLDIRSALKKVNQDQRRHARLELHCNAVVRGLNGIFRVTDISLSGVFIEPEEPVIVKIGRITDINIKLPIQKTVIRVKVKFVYRNRRGIGCEFVSLSPSIRENIKRCISEFSHTLPIRNVKPLSKKHTTEDIKLNIECPQCENKKRIVLSRNARRNLRAKMRCSCGYSWTFYFSKRTDFHTMPGQKY